MKEVYVVTLPLQVPGGSYNSARDGGGLDGNLCPSLVTLCTVSCQAPLYIGFPQQEYFSGLPFPSPITPNTSLELFFYN